MSSLFCQLQQDRALFKKWKEYRLTYTLNVPAFSQLDDYMDAFTLPCQIFLGLLVALL